MSNTAEEKTLPEAKSASSGKLKRPKKGSYYEVNTSIRKINVLRERNINFASHFALICSVVILANTASIAWKATRPVVKSKVYMQIHEEAQIMKELTIFNKRTLGAPLPYEKPVDVEKLIGELPITTEIIGIFPASLLKKDDSATKPPESGSETGIVEGQAPASVN